MVLGISPVYHMREVPKNQDQRKWISALQVKFENAGETVGREQFDEILGSYQVRSACIDRG